MTSATAQGGPVDDASIKTGTIVVEATGLPRDKLRRLEAKLFEWRRERSEAKTVLHESKRLDDTGSARFGGISAKPGIAYRVVVEHEGVPHASPTFRLHPQVGKRVPIQLFALTTDIDRALIGVQAFVYLEPRDHHIHVEQMFRFANMSELTWRQDVIPIGLPAVAEAISTGEQQGPLEATALPGRGLILRGVVPPGRTDFAFHYQIPYPSTDTAVLDLNMPARVGSVRVMAAVGANLDVRMAGAKPASASRSKDGRRMLVIDRVVQPGGDQLESVRVTLSGLPGGDVVRWLALFVTLLVMCAGLVVALLRRNHQGDSTVAQLNRRREALLEEVAKLEADKAKGRVKQEPYEVQRDLFVNQLACVLERLASNKR